MTEDGHPESSPPMPDCILHYGFPKTGSTAIQEALGTGLCDPRFRYGRFHEPPSDGGDHGRALAVLFSDRAAKFHQNLQDRLGDAELAPMRQRLVARFDNEIARLDGATLFLHAESFWFLELPGLERLRDHLRARDVRLRAVGYVRPLREASESLFVQGVKSGLGKPSLSHLGHQCGSQRRLVSSLDDLFGRERVDLWRYDRRTFPGGCVVADFCGRIGIASPPPAGDSINPGVSLDAVRLLYAYRKLGAAGIPDRLTNAALVAACGDLGGERFRLHSSLFHRAIDRHGAHLDWLEARVGATLRDGMDDDGEPSIRCEEDLLDFSRESLDWLARRTGIPAGSLAGKDPGAVAEAVGRLRDSAVAEQVATQRKASGLLARIGHRSRELLGPFGRRSS